MKRWLVALLALLAVGGFAGGRIARALGWSGSRFSALTSVTTQWLAAWMLWGLVGHLAVQARLLDVYDASFFAVIALPAALWHYRSLVAAARDRGRAIFVGVQLLWLVVVLVRNGLVF